MPFTTIAAVTRSLGQPLKGGVPNIEIRVAKTQSAALRLPAGEQRTFGLSIGKRWYTGTISHKTDVPDLYFSPSLLDQEAGTKQTLGGVLSSFGVGPNVRLTLKLGSKDIWVTDKWGNQFGTRASRLNMAITDEPKTLQQLCSEAKYPDAKSAYQHVGVTLVNARFVTRLEDGRYVARESGVTAETIPETTTIGERLLAGTLRLLGSDLSTEFHIRELRRACGVDQATWKASYGPTFQGMKENTTLGAPLVRSSHQNLYQKVSRGIYRLTEAGRAIVQTMHPPGSSGSESTNNPRQTGQGAGFGNAVDNKEVELSAIECVTADYESRGWHVEDVSKENRGYDLLCTFAKQEEHVEVKGVRGSEEEFIITAGEVRAAQTNGKFVLCVVTRALSEQKLLTRYSGREMLQKFGLTPIQYRATKQ